jgi:prepilin-type processing-associated H-X9-DG protein
MTPRSTRRFVVELTIACGLLLVLVAIVLPFLSRAREGAYRASCMNNLKQMGIVLKMYASEHREYWPPLSPYRDNWMADASVLYPEYLSDLQVLVCPNSPFRRKAVFTARGNPSAVPDPRCVSSLFYIYTGYTIVSDEEALALFEHAGEQWPGQGLKELELDVPEFPGSDRSRGSGQASIPVLWDRVPLREDEFSHVPMGINVLHMDGHVKFVPYSHYNNSNYFPATRVGAETFGSVAPSMPASCYDDWG